MPSAVEQSNMSAGTELSITTTVFGSAFAPLPRSGASAGDSVYLTGRIGGTGSALADLESGASSVRFRERFARPTPRLREARWLAAHGATAVALLAHYDSVWGSPGSGDDSLGVASALEILRAIKAKGVPARDVVVLFTDGEEIGLSGARDFWPRDGAAAHVGVVVNLEARGAGGRATMFERGAGNGAMMALFAKSVAHPVANSLSVMAYRRMPNDTDFTLVREKGLPGFNFAIMGRAQ